MDIFDDGGATYTLFDTCTAVLRCDFVNNSNYICRQRCKQKYIVSQNIIRSLVNFFPDWFKGFSCFIFLIIGRAIMVFLGTPLGLSSQGNLATEVLITTPMISEPVCWSARFDNFSNWLLNKGFCQKRFGKKKSNILVKPTLFPTSQTVASVGLFA